MKAKKSEQHLHLIYKEHHAWIYSWLCRKLGNSCDAADLAQDTFVRLMKKQKQEQIEHPRAYLTKIAKGLMLNFFHRKQIERAYLEILAESPEDLSPSPEQQLLIIETLTRVIHVIDQLPEQVQQTFLLSHLDKLKHQQIAAQLNISVSSVKRNIQKAYSQCLLLMLDEDI